MSAVDNSVCNMEMGEGGGEQTKSDRAPRCSLCRSRGQIEVGRRVSYPQLTERACRHGARCLFTILRNPRNRKPEEQTRGKRSKFENMRAKYIN
ncbi:hypothetical protein Bpfe_007638 [Biomphalaria pfeifferi]|uniref:Uncharacterized protein n=1 Tax=Biomphalaria pfeifferi TaxID=112525 RepID=A0AAD8BZA3_BIOPF|nr:hypothetical protein Bpfe_007638 [Biomphalaria pfeifferi]